MCILGISDVNIFQPRLSIFLGIPLHICWMEVGLCKTFLRAEVSKHMWLPTLKMTVNLVWVY